MLRWVARAAVSAIVIAILLTLVPAGAVYDAMRRTSVWAWSASVLVFFAGHYFNAMKLRLLVGEGRGAAAACVRAQYAGLVANLGLPGLAGGDIVRAAYLAPIVGTERVIVASLGDRMIDTVTVVVMILIALPAAGVPDALVPMLEQAGLWLAILVVLAVAAGLAALRWSKLGRARGLIARAWQQLSSRPAALASAVLISFLVQAAFALTNLWLARQVGVTVAAAAWFVAWPISKLIAILPISLGGIGVREAALVSLLAPYGAPRDAVLASGILWQGVMIVTAVTGLLVTQLMVRSEARARA